jgi:hypothetical protein
MPTCGHCGVTFDGRADARYCSPGHKKAAQRANRDTSRDANRDTAPPVSVPVSADVPVSHPLGRPGPGEAHKHAGHRIHPHAHVMLPARGTEPERLSACSGRWYCQECAAWLTGDRCAGTLAA